MLVYLSFFPLDFGTFNTSLTKSVNIVYLNTPFILSCSAQANPPASFRFYRGQESLGNISVGNTFTTSVVERRSQVNYACTSFNYFGDGQTVMIAVEVYCKYSSWLLWVRVSKGQKLCKFIGIAEFTVQTFSTFGNVLIRDQNKHLPNHGVNLTRGLFSWKLLVKVKRSIRDYKKSDMKRSYKPFYYSLGWAICRTRETYRVHGLNSHRAGPSPELLLFLYTCWEILTKKLCRKFSYAN